ncbi:MAG: DUF6353 family protein [Clostridia bacterium]
MKIDFVSTMNRVTLFLRRHSPEILVFGGVAGTVVGGVMACKATTKLPDVRKTAKKRMDLVHKENDKLESEGARRRNTAKVYFQTGFDYAKLYAPSCIIGGLSITGILAGNNILRKRNVALAAAYATLDTSFKRYRDRVADRYGEEAERQIRYDMHTQQIEETVTDENGKKKKVKKTVEVTGALSDYGRYFEHGATLAWEPSHEYNMSFLTLQQRLANAQLRSHGYLFLNEVYEMLGYEKTKAGQIVGWVYDPENAERLKTDNFVDFRILEIHRSDENDPDGFVETILLDFNVDGAVLERASDKKLI